MRGEDAFSCLSCLFLLFLRLLPSCPHPAVGIGSGAAVLVSGSPVAIQAFESQLFLLLPLGLSGHRHFLCQHG